MCSIFDDLQLSYCNPPASVLLLYQWPFKFFSQFVWCSLYVGSCQSEVYNLLILLKMSATQRKCLLQYLISGLWNYEPNWAQPHLILVFPALHRVQHLKSACLCVCSHPKDIIHLRVV